MPYCSKCGSEISQDASFCQECGAPTKIETVATPPTSPATPPTSPQTGMGSKSLIDRMIRAARLDASLYEEVEADEEATLQAVMVVILTSICSGIGTAIGQALIGSGFGMMSIGFFGGLFSALIGWVIWSFITYFVGTKVFGGTASFGELLRTIGFSNSPNVLLILSFIPILGGFISFGVWFWVLAAMIVAVRQALDVSTGNAILTCIVGFIATIIFIVALGIVLAIPFFILGS
jgi:hypothetical protein